jgi:C4-dicarboxylate transporter
VILYFDQNRCSPDFFVFRTLIRLVCDFVCRLPSTPFIHILQSLQSSSTAQMVLPICFVNIPALPQIVTSSGYPVNAFVAYAPTHTNNFGATSCGLSSCRFCLCSSSSNCR